MQTMQFYNENKTSVLTQRSTVTMVFLSLPPHLRSAIGEPNLQMEDQDQVKHLTQAPLNICMPTLKASFSYESICYLKL